MQILEAIFNTQYNASFEDENAPKVPKDRPDFIISGGIDTMYTEEYDSLDADIKENYSLGTPNKENLDKKIAIKIKNLKIFFILFILRLLLNSLNSYYIK